MGFFPGPLSCEAPFTVGVSNPRPFSPLFPRTPPPLNPRISDHIPSLAHSPDASSPPFLFFFPLFFVPPPGCQGCSHRWLAPPVPPLFLLTFGKSHGPPDVEAVVRSKSFPNPPLPSFEILDLPHPLFPVSRFSDLTPPLPQLFLPYGPGVPFFRPLLSFAHPKAPFDRCYFFRGRSLIQPRPPPYFFLPPWCPVQFHLRPPPSFFFFNLALFFFFFVVILASTPLLFFPPCEFWGVFGCVLYRLHCFFFHPEMHSGHGLRSFLMPQFRSSSLPYFSKKNAFLCSRRPKDVHRCPFPFGFTDVNSLSLQGRFKKFSHIRTLYGPPT